uniref:GRIP and coiled-coil domain-containing protein 2 n=1 Tax=Aceria tosichella TaxID=561515 RepID=A0A6G1SKS3_9ACAR
MSSEDTPVGVVEASVPSQEESNQQQLEETQEKVEQLMIPKDIVQPIKADPVAAAAANESSQKEKIGIYKALAIKLKKELIKTREELSKLKEEYRAEVAQLRDQVDTLTKTLESERVVRTNTDTTHEATIRNLRNQLEVAENELQSMQKDFDNYKTRATKLLQQANPAQSNPNKSFEEERIKQLKSLIDEQNEQLSSLRKQVKEISVERDELNDKLSSANQKLETAYSQVANLVEKNETLSAVNENLSSTIEQMNLKSRSKQWNDKVANKMVDSLPAQTGSDVDITERARHLEADDDDPGLEDANTNSNSSVDSSTSGYVHIKPTTFEIISRSSVLEDAQNQIDHLTKAYLDSENTNSLLSEQVDALKEEIRRIQRGNDRMELVNNLEYLKNILFKFLALDSSQVEQRKRLIPVLSTVLKLSPDEVNKLNSLATADKGSVTSSFFKL